MSLICTPYDGYLPDGQKVVNSITSLSDLIESNGKNPCEGTYVFYYDYGDGSGHTGFVNFDENGNNCVNLRIRDNRDFSTWFGEDESGKLYYKKLEVDIWME